MTSPATQAMRTRVMLVDDHALCRSGLSELLQRRSSMLVVGTTGDRNQVIPILRETQPELMVLDLCLGATDGLSLLRTVRSEGFDVAVVVLTMSDSEEDLSAALRAGVRGYLLKDMDPDDVIESIGRAARGELVVAPAMAAKLAQMWQSGQKGSAKRGLVDTLTDRERQVLDHVARGMSNKVIAQALDISHNTVKLHVRHIMAKLDLGSRVEAAVFAFEHRTGGDSAFGAGDPPITRR
jgi:two-component system, NarL family, nitrate/nitrite response regulator NarL